MCVGARKSSISACTRLGRRAALSAGHAGHRVCLYGFTVCDSSSPGQIARITRLHPTTLMLIAAGKHSIVAPAYLGRRTAFLTTHARGLIGCYTFTMRYRPSPRQIAAHKLFTYALNTSLSRLTNAAASSTYRIGTTISSSTVLYAPLLRKHTC